MVMIVARCSCAFSAQKLNCRGTGRARDHEGCNPVMATVFPLQPLRKEVSICNIYLQIKIHSLHLCFSLNHSLTSLLFTVGQRAFWCAEHAVPLYRDIGIFSIPLSLGRREGCSVPVLDMQFKLYMFHVSNCAMLAQIKGPVL